MLCLNLLECLKIDLKSYIKRNSGGLLYPNNLVVCFCLSSSLRSSPPPPYAVGLNSCIYVISTHDLYWFSDMDFRFYPFNHATSNQALFIFTNHRNHKICFDCYGFNQAMKMTCETITSVEKDTEFHCLSVQKQVTECFIKTACQQGFNEVLPDDDRKQMLHKVVKKLADHLILKADDITSFDNWLATQGM